MLYIGIGAVLALLLTICTIRSKARHKRVARLIRQTPVHDRGRPCSLPAWLGLGPLVWGQSGCTLP